MLSKKIYGTLFLFVSTLSCFSFFNNCYAVVVPHKESVNVLSWWGYLDDLKISQVVDQQCNIDLSIDTYYSNTEFLRRFKTNKKNYDIAIFSDTIYEIAKSQLPKSNINLALLAKDFNPTIKEHYEKQHFPHNVTFFMHSLTGFLWNPKIIDLESTDTVNNIFEKARQNIVVMLDDPVEVWNLVNRANKSNNFLWKQSQNAYSLPLNEHTFGSLVQKTNVYVTNNYNQIYDQPNFAFSFSWSGDAIVYMKKANRPYKFLIHPQLSYISTDLMVALNDQKKTACVAKALMSKKVHDIVVNSTYYISPYGEYKSVNDPMYQSIYADVFKHIGQFSWLQPMSKRQYQDMLAAWGHIQLNLHHV